MGSISSWRLAIGLLVIDLVLLFLFSLGTKELNTLSPAFDLRIAQSDQGTVWNLQCFEELPPFNKGVFRFTEAHPPVVPLPRIQYSTQEQLSIVEEGDFDRPLPEHGDVVVQYTSLGHQHPELPRLQAKSSGGGLVVLLDASGTMARPYKGYSGKASALSVALSALIKKRDNTTEPWELYSFSNGLHYHGRWAKGTMPLSSLGRANGSTALLKALSELQKNLKLGSHVVVVSDGLISERDQGSVQKRLSAFVVSGFRLSIVGPDLKAAEELNFLYKSSLAFARWPEISSISNPVNSTAQSSLTSEALWTSVPQVHTEVVGFLPVLLSNSGDPLVMHYFKGGRSIYVVLGNPPISLDRLIQSLRGKAQGVPVVGFRGETIELDVPELTTSYLRLDDGRLIAPTRPGHYKWQVAENSDSMDLSLQGYSPIALRHLNSLAFLKSVGKPAAQAKVGFEWLGKSKLGAVVTVFLVIVHMILIIGYWLTGGQRVRSLWQKKV